MADEVHQIRVDHPLRLGTALSNDLLNRRNFAQSIAKLLERVSNEVGLVMSVEGEWGSGKTSVLTMLEELLTEDTTPRSPIVVHFNPWLVGDRDALLRQFLAVITKEVALADHTGDGKKIAKKLIAYSKGFDLLKLIPGAEPWASIAKSVMESVGNTTESIAEYKTPDIEERKQELEKALSKYPTRIIVLIDDIDRLFPAEVFEMIRIVKAVGDLPNIGYVLAWDSSYVSLALEKLNVPHSERYLDKVVQVRLPVPPLSYSMRMAIMEQGLRNLPKDALKEYFHDSEERLPLAFHHGLSDLIETPRDVVRLYDIVQTIEVGLRGEIHLADIIVLAAIMIKAPLVYELLSKSPEAFVGRRPGGRNFFNKEEELIQSHAKARNDAIDSSTSPRALRELIEWLFPKVCIGEDRFGFSAPSFTEGHIGHPDRLLVALQLCMRRDDVSLVSVQQYLTKPEKRAGVIKTLHVDSCVDFLQKLGDMAKGLKNHVPINVADLGLSIAQLVDQPVFSERAHARNSIWERRTSRLAASIIDTIAQECNFPDTEQLAETIIADGQSLSVASEVVLTSFASSRSAGDTKPEYHLLASMEKREQLLKVFSDNVEQAANEGNLFAKSSPDFILWALVLHVPKRCKHILKKIEQHDTKLDRFVEAHLRDGSDSVKGQIYALPEDLQCLTAFAPLDYFKKLASARLSDLTLDYPTRAAWQAIQDERRVYGKDGSIPDR